MNEKEAREILSGFEAIPLELEGARRYLEGLAEGRKEGEARIIEKAKGLEEALKKIDGQRMPDLSDDLQERSMQLAGLWTCLKMISMEARANYEKSK